MQAVFTYPKTHTLFSFDPERVILTLPNVNFPPYLHIDLGIENQPSSAERCQHHNFYFLDLL